MPGWIDSADRWLVEQVQSLQNPVLDALFRALSGIPLRVALLFAAVVAVSLVAHSLRPAVAASLAIALALAANAAATAALKAAVDRPRPPEADPEIVPLVPVPESASFPSGHASSAFAAAAALALFLPRRRWPLVVAAALVGLSRIWLGVHYPTDVLAGALLGLAIGYLVGRVTRRRARLPTELP